MVAEGTPVVMSDGFSGGNFIWAFLLFALLGNGAWGNRGDDVKQEIWKSQDVGQIQNSVRAVQNGIADATFALNNTIKDGIYQNTQTTETARNQIANGIASATFELSNRINDVGARVKDCSCELGRAIDANTFNNERNTNAIIQSGNVNTQRILDWLCASEKNELNARLAQANQALSEQRIIAAMKPQAPIPAYTVANPYTNAYSNGCGCCYA